LLSQSAWVSGLGLLSSAAGLAIDLLTVQRFGLSAETDAALVGNTAPLLLGSIMVAAFHPALMAALPAWTRPQIARLLRTALLVGVGAALLTSLTAPLVARVLAPGAGAGITALAGLATALLAWTIPLLIVGEFCRALLQGSERFAASLAGLICANLAGLLVLLVGAASFETLILSRWARALVLAGVPGWWALRHARWGLGAMAGKLPPPRLGQNVVAASVAYVSLQAGFLLPRLMSSFLPTGSLSAFEVAWRLLSHLSQWLVFAPAMVALPALARHSERQHALGETLRGLWRVALGAAVATTALLGAGAILTSRVAARLDLGAVASADVRLLTEAVGGLALGQLSLGVLRVAHTVYLARRQPGRLYWMSAATVVGAVVGLPLGLLGVFGLALSSLISFTVGAGVGVWLLRRDQRRPPTPHPSS
jgi:peptidoglycan biosynthesis protein MviN/MurJ (putative lipid II flippase)